MNSFFYRSRTLIGLVLCLVFTCIAGIIYYRKQTPKAQIAEIITSEPQSTTTKNRIKNKKSPIIAIEQPLIDPNMTPISVENGTDLAPYRLGFTSLHAEFKYKDLSTEGCIPDWLNGSFVAVGPGKFEINESKARTWLDGFAMVHRFSFKEGRVSYANKFLETNYYNDSIATGAMSTSASAGDPNASYFSKLAAAMSDSSDRIPYDNTNVNVVCHNHLWMTLTDAAQPTIYDRHTLKTKGLASFNDDYKPHVSCAHPFIDQTTGQWLSVMTTYARSKSSYTIYTMEAKSFKRVPLVTISASYPSYMHSFAVTPGYIVLTEIPCVVNPYDLVMSGKPYLENFQWKPKQGAKITVINRSNGSIVGTYNTEPFFTLHHINAFEENGSIIIDLAAHENHAIIKSYVLHDIHTNPAYTFWQATIKRITIKPQEKTVSIHSLSSTPIEMPRINDAYKTRAYTYVYALSSHDGHSYFNRLVKINLATNTNIVWHADHCHPSEPVFVAAPHAKHEDDGVLLSIVLDTKAKTSFLLILDAPTMEELGRVPLPHHIPFTVHGDFFHKPTTLKEQFEEHFKL